MQGHRRQTLFGLIAILCLSTPAFAEELWRGASAGMTVAEVQHLFPAAHRFANPAATSDGWVELLHADNVDLEGHREGVEFLFKNERLIAINTMIGGKDAPYEISGAGVRAILADLRKKYGEPVRCKNEDIMTSCFWIVDGKFIGYMGRDSVSRMVMLFFHHALPSDAHLLEH
ncbi:MAG TPA: hypothetical protein VG407_10140 [Caulobacteraceae bacterium]|nr:hypothetical protein [Caulobacteraceae bacterium]